jgi:hypothetical protein
MHGFRFLLFILVLVFILIFTFPHSSEAATLSECGNITSPGFYTLSNDVSSNTTCFNITSSDVNLDCKGHTLTGSQNGNGFYIKDRTNVTVKSCQITNFSRAIHLGTVGSSIFDNLTIYDNKNGDYTGIYAYQSNSNYFTSSNFSYNRASRNAGIILYNSNSSKVENNNFQDNIVIGGTNIQSGGILGLYTSSNNTITNTTLTGNNATAGNSIFGGGILGLYISANNNTITNTTLTGNSVTSNAFISGGGILGVESTSNNNTITDTTMISNNVTAVNEIGGGGILGVDLGSEYNKITNTILTGNKIDVSDDIWGGGVLGISSSGYNKITNTTLTGNSVTGTVYITGGVVGIDIANNNTLTTITVDNNNVSTTSYMINTLGLYGAHDSNFTDINLKSNKNYGINSTSSNNVIFSNINVTSSKYHGISIFSSNFTNITSCRILSSSDHGIYLFNSLNNSIYNNFLNNTNNTKFDGDVYENFWNTTLNCTAGTNIAGGPCLGGNYWGKPDGTGYSDTCQDGNMDGICMNPLTLNASNVDYLPLTEPSGNLTNCTNIISPGFYNLSNDVNSNTTCFNITSSDVILDCTGHVIEGFKNLDTYGIHAENSIENLTNITITNCNVKNWYHGIRLVRVNNSLILNTTSHNNNQRGIYFFESLYNNITKFAADNNTIGIYFGSSQCNNISDVTTNDNNDGIQIYTSSNNTLSDIITINNTAYGIYIYSGSMDNFLNNITAKYNAIGIQISEGSYNTLINVKTGNNTNKGTDLSSSTNNLLIDITANNNTNEGVYLYNSTNNNLTNVISNHNNDGIRLYLSKYNNITTITSCYNTQHGTHISSYSDGNRLTDVNSSWNGDGDDYGVYIFESLNNTLSNVSANNNDYVGVHLEDSNYTTLTIIVANNNTDTGVWLYNASQNNFNNLTAWYNDVYGGIYLQLSSDMNNFTDVDASYSISSDGLVIDGSYFNTITGGKFSENSDCGIWIYQASSNELTVNKILYNNGSDTSSGDGCGIYLESVDGSNSIYNNLFNNSENAIFFPSGSPNENNWNITKQSGTNIVGGSYLGGNYWGEPNGTGDSDTCNDVDSDGICDNAIQLGNNNYDYLPLAKTGNFQNCGNITSPGVYLLQNDIEDWSSGSCFNVSTSNVTLDCQGHLVDGTNITNSYGFLSQGVSGWELSNVTVRNCDFKDWHFDIQYQFTYDGLIDNITANYGTPNGGATATGVIYVSFSDFNNISNSNFNSIQISDSNENMIENISVEGGFFGRGIFLTGWSENNTFYNVNVTNVRGVGPPVDYGIYISINSVNNSFFNVNVSNTENYGIYVSDDYNSFFGVNVLDSDFCGIYVGGSSFNSFENVNITDSGQEGLIVSSANNNSFMGMDITNSVSNGIFFGAGDASQYNSFYDVYIFNSGTYGIQFNNGDNNYFDYLTVSSASMLTNTGLWLKSTASGNIFNNSLVEGIDDYGFHLDGSQNNVIENTIVKNIDDFSGIYLVTASGNIFNNSLVEGIHEYGFRLDGSQNNVIENTTIRNINILSGIYLNMGSDSNEIVGVDISDAPAGIQIRNADSNNVSHSRITDCSAAGIYFESTTTSAANLFFNNFFNNTDNYENLNPYENYWNTTKQPGINIMGGPFLGGNYWGTPAGTGFSDNCTNHTKGICDNSYLLGSVGSDNEDFLPLTIYALPPQFDFWNLTDYTTGAIVPSNSYLDRYSKINASAHWIVNDSTLTSAMITHNGTGSFKDYEITGPYTNNYTNYTMDLSNTTDFPLAGMILVNYIKAFAEYAENSTYPPLGFSFWGFASVDNITILEDDYIYKGETVQLGCKVADSNSSMPINGYTVSFYNDTAFLGTNSTGSDGWAYLDYTDTSLGPLDYNLSCNISDQAPLFYNASSDYTKEKELHVVEVRVVVTSSSSLLDYGSQVTFYANVTGNLTPIQNVELNASYTKIGSGGNLEEDFYSPSGGMTYNLSYSPTNHLYSHTFTPGHSGLFNATVNVTAAWTEPALNYSYFDVKFGTPDVEATFPNFRVLSDQKFNLTINLTSASGDLWLANVTLNFSLGTAEMNITGYHTLSKQGLYNVSNGTSTSIEWECESLEEGLTRVFVSITPQNGSSKEFSIPFSVLKPIVLADPDVINYSGTTNLTAKIVGNVSEIESVWFFIDKTPDHSVHSPTFVKNESDCVGTGAGVGNIAPQANETCDPAGDCYKTNDDNTETSWTAAGSGKWTNLSFDDQYVISEIEIVWKDLATGSNVTVYYTNTTGSLIELSKDVEVPDDQNTTELSDFVPFETNSIVINQTTSSTTVVYEVRIFSVEERVDQCYVFVANFDDSFESGDYNVNTTVYTDSGNPKNNFTFFVNYGWPQIEMLKEPVMIINSTDWYEVRVTATSGDLRDLSLVLGIENKSVINLTLGSWNLSEDYIPNGFYETFKWNVSSFYADSTDTNVTVNSTTNKGLYGYGNWTFDVVSDPGEPPNMTFYWLQQEGVKTNSSNMFSGIKIYAYAYDDIGMKGVKASISDPVGGSVNGSFEIVNSTFWEFEFGNNEEGVELNITGNYTIEVIAMDIGAQLKYSGIDNGSPQNYTLTVVDYYTLDLENFLNATPFFNRGEDLTVRAYDVNGLLVQNLSWSVNLTKYNQSMQELNDTGNSYEYQLNSTDPLGNYSLSAFAEKNNNTDSDSWEFNVSNVLSPAFNQPPSNSVYTKGTVISTPVVEVLNRRGQTLEYVANVMLDCPNNDFQIDDHLNGKYLYYSVTDECRAHTSAGTTFYLYASVLDVFNNSGSGSLTLRTQSESGGDPPGGNGGSPPSGGFIAPPPSSCNCTGWVDVACGLSNCTGEQVYQTRTCEIPSTLCPESRCFYSETCLEKLGFDFSLSEEEATIAQGNDHKIKIRVNNTGNMKISINVSPESECCYLYLPDTLALEAGDSADIFMDMHVPLNQSTGDCEVNINLASGVNRNTKGLKLTIVENDFISTLIGHENRLGGVESEMAQLLASGIDVSSLNKMHDSAMHAVEMAMADIDRDDLDGLEMEVKNLGNLMWDIESSIAGLLIYKFLFDNVWYITGILVLSILIIYMVTQILLPFSRLGREIVALGKKEFELVQTRISTEKQYFKRQISEATFNKILIKKQEEILRSRGLLTAKKKERGVLIKTRISPRALGNWLVSGPKKVIHRVRRGAKKEEAV